MLDIVNRYAHGFVSIPVILACRKQGLFQKLQQTGSLPLDRLGNALFANHGHLRVALRLLQSLGFVSVDQDDCFTATQETDVIRLIPEDVLELYHFPFQTYCKERIKKHSLRRWIKFSLERWRINHSLLSDFLDGVLVIPLLLALKETHCLHEADELFSDLSQTARQEVTDLFMNLGWVTAKGKKYTLTEPGIFMATRALNLATTASYRPMLSLIPQLLFGDPHAVFQRTDLGHESHVNRSLNVIGSGFQHERFFADADEIILNIFNHTPILNQPQYIVDMGCGDGSFLKRIYDTIRLYSARGAVLEQYPLTLIGVDFNQESLELTAANLAGIPHLVLQGDIGNPEHLLRDLLMHGIDPKAVLHVRSFLDHDRPFISPLDSTRMQLRSETVPQSRVISVDRTGHLIPSHVAAQSLVEHLERWADLVTTSHHGLLLLEVHCLDPEVVKTFLDFSESLHFDAYHAFSLQHLVVADIFLMAAAEAGLFPQMEYAKKYPKVFPFTRITLNYFEKKNYIVRHPNSADYTVLTALEKECWPEHQQASQERIHHWLEDPSHHLVLEMNGQVAGVIYTQTLESAPSLPYLPFAEVDPSAAGHGQVLRILHTSIQLQIEEEGIGEEFRSFLLQWARVKGGVVGIVDAVPDSLLGGEQEKWHCMFATATPVVQASQSEALPILVEKSVKFILGEQRLQAYQPDRPLMEMGLDSLDLLELRSLLGQQLHCQLEPTFFFRYGTPIALANYFQNLNLNPPAQLSSLETGVESKREVALDQKVAERPIKVVAEQRSAERQVSPAEPIAIMGQACRFPGGVNSPDTYWDLLRQGIDAITIVPPNRWNVDQIGAGLDPSQRECLRLGGFIDQVDRFDAPFFHISPREATLMDPQQRILLEESWKALENAAINPHSLSGSQTGIFVGIIGHDYEVLQSKYQRPENLEAHYSTGNSAAVAAGRLAYFYGTQGPALSVDTACSSSLVAVHLACQSLTLRECNLAIVAGISLILTPELSIAYAKAGMLSADGRCHTFDAGANGFVRSEGCGVIILKRLCDALADGEQPLAILRGTAVNQDGTSNSLTAPNGLAQEALFRQTLANAGVTPTEVDYVETHGTGTALGDPVEVKALEAVYGTGRNSEHPLVLASVKTNIGHTEAAAGLAGLIKVVLSLQHRYIPPHLHFQTLNPHIVAPDLPFIIPKSGREWQSHSDKKLVAGVSSFGFSGTNAHVLVEEAPDLRLQRASRFPLQLLTLSAETDTALRDLVQRYVHFLSANPSLSLEEICFTTQVGRAHFSHRLAIVTESVTDLHQQLSAYLAGKEVKERIQVNSPAGKPRVAFLFTGQGCQYEQMGRQLYETQPVFRQSLEECQEILRDKLEQPLLAVLYPEDEGSSPLQNTLYTQPALFALEYSLAQMWMSWGIQPAVLMGHSLGEYVAACVAGVFSLEDGLKLVVERARLMQALPSDGAMISAMADAPTVQAAIAAYPGQISIAAFNGPESVVFSGERQAVMDVAADLEGRGIKVNPLNVAQAFHSPLMDPILKDFAEVARQIQFSAPQFSMISNISGELAGIEIATSEYWVNHIRQSVKFAQGIQSLELLGVQVYLEIGPKPILLGMGRQCISENQGFWLPSLRPGRSDWEQILISLGQLYVHKSNIDWQKFNEDHSPCKISGLPTYPFQHQHFWIKPSVPLESTLVNSLNLSNQTQIVSFLNQQDVQSLIQLLEEKRQFTPEQKQIATEVLNLLTAQHQVQLQVSNQKLIEAYYNSLTQVGFFFEGHLNFVPFPNIVPGFSFVLMAANSRLYPEFMKLVRIAHREMRDVLFHLVDFYSCQRILDFGCGYGTDLITFAQKYTHVQLDGYTLSDQQLKVGVEKAESLGFQDRIHIFKRDSAHDPFPDQYDLVFGLEVACHIKNKQNLFANISSHLNQQGMIVLADFVSHAEFSIDHDVTSSYLISIPEWVKIFSDQHLRVVKAINMSQEVANSLYDPDFETNLEQSTNIKGDFNIREAFRSYNNQRELLVKGLLSYVLLTLQKTTESTIKELTTHN
jgi:acyl transferase domain-containing protein/cyclopropane fatty-acyl-phospholipid synthase-like methyltransferase/acyl carrier protein